MPLLRIENVTKRFGGLVAVNDVSFEVEEGESIAIVGSNGSGKTTLYNVISGVHMADGGKIIFAGKDITGLPPYQIGRMGITLAPQGRRIFPSLTVRENLAVAAFNNSKSSRSSNLEKIFSLFPVLKERSDLRAKTLSGGEMQMLAIGRALMAAPKLLLMDEPTEGLAPLLVQEIKQVILSIKSEKKTSLLLVEQNFSLILEVADYVYVMSKGRVVYESYPKDLMNNEEVKVKYLGLRK
jgi:branched-chain amino acid transport system ATP-binding protein